MSMDGAVKPALGGLGGLKRRAVSVASGDLVKEAPLFAGRDLPLLVEPALPGCDLASWAAANREGIEAKLHRHGGILFRGFQIDSPQELERFIAAFAGQSLEYRERSSPRTAVAGNIYTSTDYPPSHAIFLHNENSYQSQWPLRIFFCCAQPAEGGGQTPLADCRRVLARIDPAVRDRFARQGWMYVRNFGDGFGLAWETVFQTADRAEVEEHCRRSGIATEWKEGGRLRTRAVRPALARHPKTGEVLWFNHATFFNAAILPSEILAGLRAQLTDSELPTNTFYGDGAVIEPEVMAHLRAAYERETVSFDWQQGDLLLLDNMLVAHGRAPFAGERRILVGMAEPVTREQAQV
jgi:alpha-ketoglutarate-dependent taurine dioxygenase